MSVAPTRPLPRRTGTGHGRPGTVSGAWASRPCCSFLGCTFCRLASDTSAHVRQLRVVWLNEEATDGCSALRACVQGGPILICDDWLALRFEQPTLLDTVLKAHTMLHAILESFAQKRKMRRYCAVFLDGLVRVLSPYQDEMEEQEGWYGCSVAGAVVRPVWVFVDKCPVFHKSSGWLTPLYNVSPTFRQVKGQSKAVAACNV